MIQKVLPTYCTHNWIWWTIKWICLLSPSHRRSQPRNTSWSEVAGRVGGGRKSRKWFSFASRSSSLPLWVTGELWACWNSNEIFYTFSLRKIYAHMSWKMTTSIVQWYWILLVEFRLNAHMPTFEKQFAFLGTWRDNDEDKAQMLKRLKLFRTEFWSWSQPAEGRNDAENGKTPQCWNCKEVFKFWWGVALFIFKSNHSSWHIGIEILCCLQP